MKISHQIVQSTISVLSCLVVLLFTTPTLQAEQLCQQLKISKGKIVSKSKTIADGARCPRGYALLISTTQGVALKGPQGDPGSAGADGAAGADGTLRVYGDGSRGPLTISTNTNWGVSPPTANNLQFTDFSVAAGATLTVPSGTVIRATGAISIAGTIAVMTGTSGSRGRLSSDSIAQVSPAVLNWAKSSPVEGPLSFRAAMSGQTFEGTTVVLIGGFGGNSLLSAGSVLGGPTSLLPVNLGTRGGSGGAGYIGGDGGGVVYLIAKGALTVGSSGTINADGDSGSTGGGGGGGGIVVLASQAGVANSGVIEARGGAGGAAGVLSGVISIGAGGGGGGGVVHFISPGVSPGVTALTGGASGSIAASLNTALRSGGGGGGAGAGIGGSGGAVPAGATVTSGLAGFGDDGRVIETVADPTSLLW